MVPACALHRLSLTPPSGPGHKPYLIHAVLSLLASPGKLSLPPEGLHGGMRSSRLGFRLLGARVYDATSVCGASRTSLHTTAFPGHWVDPSSAGCAQRREGATCQGQRAARMTSCALWGMRKSGQNGGFRSTCAGDRGRLHVTGAQARSGEGTSGGEEGAKRDAGGSALGWEVTGPRTASLGLGTGGPEALLSGRALDR